MSGHRKSKPREINGLGLMVAIKGDSDRLRDWARREGYTKEWARFCKELEPFWQAARIADLLVAYQGNLDAAKADLLKVGRILLRPEKAAAKAAGRPLQWTRSDLLVAWLAVESEHRALLRANPKATIKAAINVLFTGLPKSGKVCVGNSSDGRSLFVTRETAEKYHRSASNHLKLLPLAEKDRWHRLARVRKKERSTSGNNWD